MCQGNRCVGFLEHGEMEALTFTALSLQSDLPFIFQVDGEGFEGTLDASSLDFKVPPVIDYLVPHGWKLYMLR